MPLYSKFIFYDAYKVSPLAMLMVFRENIFILFHIHKVFNDRRTGAGSRWKTKETGPICLPIAGLHKELLCVAAN